MTRETPITRLCGNSLPEKWNTDLAIGLPHPDCKFGMVFKPPGALEMGTFFGLMHVQRTVAVRFIPQLRVVTVH